MSLINIVLINAMDVSLVVNSGTVVPKQCGVTLGRYKEAIASQFSCAAVTTAIPEWQNGRNHGGVGSLWALHSNFFEIHWKLFQIHGNC